jgi:hypothetical protein
MGPGAVRLEHSLDKGISWRLIAPSLDNSGAYAWQVPDTVCDSALVRIFASDLAGNGGADTSGGFFAITDSVGWINEIEISPDTAVISSDSTKQFRAVGHTAGGETVNSVACSWLVTGGIGTIDGSGRFDARRAGTGRIVARYGGLFDTSGVITVVAGAVRHVAVSGISGELSADSSISFTATVSDADSNVIPSPSIQWSVSGGIGSIGSTGVFSAGRTGSGAILAVCQGISDTSAPITVVPGVLARLEVSPDTATISADEMLQFSVKGYDSDGNAVAAGGVVWALAGGSGTIDNGGVLTPGLVDTLRIAAIIGSIGDTSGTVRVLPGMLASVVISPDTVDTIMVNDTIRFVCEGADRAGNRRDPGAVHWGVTDQEIGVIGDGDGVFVAVRRGTVIVYATARNGAVSGFSDTIFVQGALLQPGVSDTIDYEENGVAIAVPPLAIDSAIVVSVSVADTSGRVPAGLRGCSVLFSIRPDDVAFDSLVRIRVRMEPPPGAGENGHRVRLFRFNEQYYAWDVVFDSHYDSSTGTVEGNVGRFGLFMVGIDTVPPAVAPAAPPRVDEGDGIHLSVDIDDNIVSSRVIVYYKRGGDTEYRDTVVTVTGGRLDIDFGPDMSSPRGFEYYVVGDDGTNRTGSAPASVQVAVENVQEDGPLDTMVWRLVSVPMLPSDSTFSRLFAALGGYDPAQWKVYAWNNGMLVEVMNSGMMSLRTGVAYWCKIREKLFMLTSGQALSVPTSTPYDIVLAPGWNLISNPYMFDVSWTALSRTLDSLGLTDDVSGPYAFDGETWRLPWPVGELVALETWSGYAMHNASGGEIRIPLPAYAFTVSQAKKMALPKENFWCVRMTARCGAGASPHLVAGIHPAALDGKDRYDFLEPPQMEPAVSMAIKPKWAKGRRYLADMRAPIEEGQKWTFDVENARGAAEVEFSVPDIVFEKWQVFVYDEYRKCAHDISQDNRYRFTAGSDSRRTLTLVVGTGEYCRRIIKSFEVPAAFGLAQNYPNPLSAVTYIYYQLARPGAVRLEVFDMQGRRIVQLVNSFRESGYYRATWDGRDEHNKPVASGVYLYKINVSDRKTGSRLFDKIRIMRVMR